MTLNAQARAAYERMDLLRFTTAGSVDDGKSTLIGRLLYDSKGVFEDQLESLRRTSARKGASEIDLALLTDGLSAEREQGITIDVAYRYFATSRRKFIIADTPGHEQYTRNMVTGASTSQLAVVLVDARKGVVTQTRRHAALAHLLRIPRLVLAVNKMDLVDWSEEVFQRIRADFEAIAREIGAPEPVVIPLSALKGDNVVEESRAMGWYGGPSLLGYLETVPVDRDWSFDEFRFPVQYVIRPHADYRGYAGRVASGVVQPGDLVRVMSSGLSARVKAVDTFDGELAEAFPPQSVTLRLEDEVDLSRGDMLADPDRPPRATSAFTADLCWMGTDPLELGRKYHLKHTTRTVRALVEAVENRLDVNTLERVPAAGLSLNDIARVRLRTLKPLYADPYARNRRTGNFILIDELSNNTVAAGMIVDTEIS